MIMPYRFGFPAVDEPGPTRFSLLSQTKELRLKLGSIQGTGNNDVAKKYGDYLHQLENILMGSSE